MKQKPQDLASLLQSHRFLALLLAVLPTAIFAKGVVSFWLLSFPLNRKPPEDQHLICGVHRGAPTPCRAHSGCWTDVSGIPECAGLRRVMSALSFEREAGPECGAGWRPSSSCVQASLAAPWCISLSCDLPERPAPTPVSPPTRSWSRGGTVFGLSHVSEYPRGISPPMRRIKSLTF